MRKPFSFPKDREDLLRLSASEQSLLAVRIREKLIDTVSKCGGHLASNLGVVELTIALNTVFDTAHDKVVWDVGHQTYVHKMLTGRDEALSTLRCLDGVSGFPKREESLHDHYDAGHSGTSVSAALGYAEARDLLGEDHACVAVIGDGSLTAGVAYEALNAAGSEATPLIVVLNDNNMSISRNVGGMSKHLLRLRTSSPYLGFKRRVKRGLRSAPRLEKGAETMRNILKYATQRGVVFEELGFKYFGPIDGHDIEELIQALTQAKELRRPVIVHAVTVKGKGYRNAENKPDLYHSTGPFDPQYGVPLLAERSPTYTDLFGETLLRLAEQDERIVAITAAMTDGTGLSAMTSRFPERVFDVGIAEQHAVSFAAGMALSGLRPVVAMYSTFLQRAYDQVLTEVCLQGLPVLFAIDRAGISGPDGETHHGQFDYLYLSSMPDMNILAPKDGIELQEMLAYALAQSSPCAIRFPKGKAGDLSSWGRTPMNGQAECIRGGVKNAIVTVGTMCETGLRAHDLLRKRGISAAVFNLRCAKPLPIHRLNVLLGGYDRIVTLEDGTADGGIGMRIGAALQSDLGRRMPRLLHIGWPDRFIPHGTIEELNARYSLDAQSVADQAEVFFEKTVRYPPQ